MRSIISIVLPAIAAISISGLMFTATLAQAQRSGTTLPKPKGRHA